MDDTHAPFSFGCPGCGADIDAKDIPFELGAAVLTPDRDWMLWEVFCHNCGTRTDAASWLIDGDEMFRDSEAAASMSTPDAASLLDRYVRRVSRVRDWWLERLSSSDGGVEAYPVAIGRESFRLSEAQSFGCPADVLAAARGLREAVEAHPGGQKQGRSSLDRSYA